MQPVTEISISNFRFKDYRLLELSLKRFAEAGEGNKKYNATVSIVTESGLGINADESFSLITLKMDVSISVANEGQQDTLIAQIKVALQGVFIHAEKLKLVPGIGADASTIARMGEYLFPVAQKNYKDICAEAALPTIAIFTDVSKPLAPPSKSVEAK